MPKARPELLDSALSYTASGENRLTEVLATVLASNPDFARALMEDVGLPVGERFSVSTQDRVAPACTPDLIVTSYGAQGGLVSVLWSEHKTVSGFRPQQQGDYVKALSAEPGTGRLLTVTVDSVEEDDGQWERRTWQDIGELADRVGTAWQRPRWRQTALAVDAPASYRILHEFLWYLEKEGFAVVRAATTEDLAAFSHFVDAVETLATLAGKAGGLLGLPSDEDIGQSYDLDAFWMHVTPPVDAWLERLQPFDAHAEFILAADGGWSPAGAGVPSAGAGYTMSAELHGTLSSDAEWVDRLDAAGYSLEKWGEGGWVRCWRTRPLSEIVEAGTTLTEQARELARWVRESVDDLSALAPGELSLPEPRKRRSRKATESDPPA